MSLIEEFAKLTVELFDMYCTFIDLFSFAVPK